MSLGRVGRSHKGQDQISKGSGSTTVIRLLVKKLIHEEGRVNRNVIAIRAQIRLLQIGHSVREQ